MAVAGKARIVSRRNRTNKPQIKKGVAEEHPSTPFPYLTLLPHGMLIVGARLSSPRFRLHLTCENRGSNVTKRCVSNKLEKTLALKTGMYRGGPSPPRPPEVR